jgi:uncharacterized ferritin-like protein (DUF455 family)
MTAAGEDPSQADEGNAATDLFSAAAACLSQRDPETKTRWTAETAAAWRSGKLPLGDRERPPGETAPGRPEHLPLVPPLKVPKRKLGTERGHAAFVHAIAHIEFNAINLAWDCVQRFRDLPPDFYDDWVSVAADEARHFSMLAGRLGELGFGYGDFEAHDGLWEMAEKTRHDPVARMAMVPRFLEARGLDVAPSMIKRLDRIGDEKTAGIVRIILREEVAHVAAGSKWFRHLCIERGDEPEAVFSELIDRYLVGAVKGPLNLEHRRQAGFTERELVALAARKPARR